MTQPTLTVALTGATGFVGRHVLPHLLEAGHHVRALVRDPRRLVTRHPRLVPIEGDLDHTKALAELVRGVDAVVHLVGIIMQQHGQTFQSAHVRGPGNLLAAARAARVKRWVHMSALGSRDQAASEYHRTKYAFEQALIAADMDWTIFRPSIIHGPDGEFTRMLKKFVTSRLNPPFIPYFGAGLLGKGGAGKLQPVYVEDVARCFTDALRLPATVGEIYPMGGPDAMTWPAMYEICKKVIPGARAKKPIVAVPVWYARMIAGMPGVPFNLDQVIMSQEDSVCQIGKVQHDFSITLAPFENTLAGYAHQIN